MNDNGSNPSSTRLVLPPAAIRKLAESGIRCTPQVSLEYRRSSDDYVLRGRESGGATHHIGRYAGFCGPKGEPLPWFLRPDSITPNAEHAVVLAPGMVSIEMFRFAHTYELLVQRYQIEHGADGRRPTIVAVTLFRGWQGQLALDLVGQEKALAGQIAPEFFTRAGERRPLPAEYVHGIEQATLGVNCVNCLHTHLLVENVAQAPVEGAAEISVAVA